MEKKLKTCKSDCRRCMRCWTCAWTEKTTNTPNLHFLELRFTTTHNFVFPNLEVGHGKYKLKTRKSDCRRCMRCWACAWIEQTTNTPHLHFLEFEVGKGKRQRKKRCTRCCNFAQIWHPSPCNYIFPSFQVGSEKGRTEEIEFDNLYHHPQFRFPEPWSGTWKIKTENTQIRLSQVHEMLNLCMNWTDYQHPTPTFSRVLRWQKENDRGRTCNWLAAGGCCNFAQIWHPSPSNYIFRSFEVGNEESRTEEIEFDNLYHHPRISFSRTLKWDMENKNWKHANQIAAGAWDVEHVHELNKLPTPHLHFLAFWGGKKKTTEEENVIWLAAGLRDVILRKYDTPAPTITFSGVLR